MSEQLRILVLGGGRSSEHEVSLASARSIADGLVEAGFLVRRVHVQRDGSWYDVTEFGDGSGDGDHGGAEIALRPGRGIADVDVVFPALHGPFGEDGTVQGLLESLGVPYVGAGVLASAVCMDKVVFKDLMAKVGVAQVNYRSVSATTWQNDPEGVLRDLSSLGLPVFVKPARMGSSIGIARVAAAEELRVALDEAFRFDRIAIVEAAATGIEVECSVLGNEAPIASDPGEIMLATGESGWYDYDAKYTPGRMQLVVPARISNTASERVRELAVQAFSHVGCAGLARADFFVDGEAVLLNELNTMPGFTPTSVYGALWAAGGVEYPELLARLVELARSR